MPSTAPNLSAVCFTVAGNTPQIIPANQEARLLLFLSRNTDSKLHWDDLYQALGKSPEVNRCLSTLRNKWGVPVHCEVVRTEGGRGKYGLYWLDAQVKVWRAGAPRGEA